MPEAGVETIVQALPIVMTAALLLTLVALLVRSRGLARARRDEAATVSRQSAALQHPVAGTDAGQVPRAETQTGSEHTSHTNSGAAIRAEPGAAASLRPPAASKSAEELRRDIARHENAGERNRLSELHMELGEQLLAAGQMSDAAAELRKSIMSAARLRQHGTHASARLLLGDIAEREGDLTTACEHWQIARSLFQDLKVAVRYKEADARMRRIGCPTDWVLNDF